jgi:hypothetical protein
MAYVLRGTTLENCHCHDVCPCNVDLRPNGPDGECKGWLVFHIREGNKDDVDLSGQNVALVLSIPDKPSAGNWRIGIIADSDATDDQAQALEAIFTGKDGGPWGEFAGLFSEYMGMQRARVTYNDGETPSSSVEGSGDLTFEPMRDMEGKPTMLVNSAFGMGPNLGMGRGSGHAEAFGLSFDSTWGELSEVEFAS